MTASQPTTNAAAFAAAQAVIPGGVDSPVRAFGSVGGTPRFMAGARGPYLTDVEGNEYVDLVCSWGPMLLGHQHPEVVEAVHAAVDRGLGFGTSTLEETALAELIASKVPVERVRFVSTGTEATMTALRLARGVTGRNLIVKFAGCYHGHSDGLLAAAALGGSAEIMDHLAPLGPVYQAGTLSGNPVAMAAGHATLSRADEAVYAAVTRASDAVREGLVAALDAEGVDHSIQRAGTLFSLAFGTSGTGVRDYRDAQGQEVFRYAPFFQSMLASGVYLPPSVFEAWFVSAAHDDAAVTRVLDALPAAAKAAAAATPQG